MKSIRLILWDHLSPDISSLEGVDPKRDLILFLETIKEATSVGHHVKKLAFLFSAMRHFAHSLEKKGFRVAYTKISAEEESLTTGLKKALHTFGADKIIVTQPGEYRVWKELKAFETLEIREDSRFFCTTGEFADWAKNRKQLVMESFYHEMRKKTELLMDSSGQPMGGAWNTDKENRKPPNSQMHPPVLLKIKPDAITRAVLSEVKQRFSNHFGDLEPFWFAVTAEEAEKTFRHFVETALPSFGTYQDAMVQGEHFLYHSVISHALNCGLLSPKKVCQAVHEAYLKKKIPLNSAEGYIRQILGWREYVRGVYWLKMPSYAKLNFFEAKRKLPWFYWSAQTDLNCLKQCIEQTKQQAYSHHIQRLMVTGNFALLIGVLPQEICDWYLAVYADAHEWVELPNTLGMSQYADGGFLATKPYASSGSYINKMSNFCKTCKYKVAVKEGPQACPFNYLYWDFLLRNEKKLSGNIRLAMAYQTLRTFTAEKKKAIKADAKRFLESLE